MIKIDQFKEPIESCIKNICEDILTRNAVSINSKLNSKLYVNQLSEKLGSNYFSILKRAFNVKLHESKEFNVPFSLSDAINLSVRLTTESVNKMVEKELLQEEAAINNLVRVLNGKGMLEIKKILLGEEINESISASKNSSVINQVKREKNFVLNEVFNRLTVKSDKLKRLLTSTPGKNLLNTLSKEPVDEKLILNLSKRPALIEAILIIADDERELQDLMVNNIPLLKMMSVNKDLLPTLRRKPKLVKIFKNDKFNSVADSHYKELPNIINAMPNRIINSPVGRLNVSHSDYSKLSPRTRDYIDRYRNLMANKFNDNLFDIFESHIYYDIRQALSDIYESGSRESDILTEHLSEFYLNTFKSRFNKVLNEHLESVTGSADKFSGYFESDSSIEVASEYSTNALKEYILSEGFFGDLMKKIKGASEGTDDEGNRKEDGIGGGLLGSIKNFLKDRTISRFMRRVVNTIPGDIRNWDKKLSPSQKKAFNKYPFLKAVFADTSNGRKALDPELAVDLINNRTVMKLLEKCPKLVLAMKRNEKLAEFLIRREPEILEKMMKNLSTVEWILDSKERYEKIIGPSNKYPNILHACILNFDLAAKIVNNMDIIDEVGEDNLVDLAELMNGTSNLSQVLKRMDSRKFLPFVKTLFSNVKTLTFLKDDKLGKELAGVILKDRHDTIIKAINNDPELFDGDHDIKNIDGNDDYNKLMLKYANIFPKDERSGESGSSGSNKDIKSEFNSINLSDSGVIKDFINKYIKAGFLPLVYANGDPGFYLLNKNETHNFGGTTANFGHCIWWVYQGNDRKAWVVPSLNYLADGRLKNCFDIIGNPTYPVRKLLEPAVLEKNAATDQWECTDKGIIKFLQVS